MGNDWGEKGVEVLFFASVGERCTIIINSSWPQKLGGVFKYFFIFTPDPWGNDPI